jgi:hypothetical protein
MAKTGEISYQLKVDAKVAEKLTALLESMVRNRAVLPGECIIALDAFAADAKGLDSLFVVADSPASDAKAK